MGRTIRGAVDRADVHGAGDATGFAVVLRRGYPEPDELVMLVTDVRDALDLAQEMRWHGHDVDIRESRVCRDLLAARVL